LRALREAASDIGPRAALSVVALRCALEAGLLRGASPAEVSALRERTAGALPPWPLPRKIPPALLDEPIDLCAAAEELCALALGPSGRRSAGVYYTPPDLAAQVVDLALRHGSARSPRRVLDPCAGAGAFLREAARRCPAASWEGADLDGFALRAARAALALVDPDARPVLRRLDSLRSKAQRGADLLVSNPPYGHVDDPRERAFLARELPALRGGEIDRYAAFLLRALQLVQPGGTAALLVPDTWMTNARAGPLRGAVLDSAEIAAVADLRKPFAAAKDTRVQAVVLVRRADRRPRPAHVYRGDEPLAPVCEDELRRNAVRGWQLYRSEAERRLCAAMEAASVPLGTVCEVGYGLRTGDNARFVARRAESGIALCGGEDVVPYALRLRPKELVDPTPALLALARRQLGRARVCVQRIRTNSTQPHARWLEAAPVPPDLVCLDSLSTLACESELLRALLALVQSVPLQRWHRLRTTDVNVKPSALRELPVPRALIEPGGARELSALAAARVADPLLDRAVDACAYRLFGLPQELVAEAERGFWGALFDEQFQLLDRECRTPSLRFSAG
jgi:predicted RNA methylase